MQDGLCLSTAWKGRCSSLSLSGEYKQHAKFDDTPCGLGVLPDGRIILLTMFRKRLLAHRNGELSLDCRSVR